MAVAATETLSNYTSQEAHCVRPPEQEVYGRSLSTIYKLGAYMVGKTVNEAVQSPEAEQARVEFYTSVEEGFGTDMELGGGLEVRDFDTRAVIDGRVMAKDLKTPVSDMTHAGLINAEEKVKRETARSDHRFLPQYTRSKWDHENALQVDKMARRETSYNTRMIISPFPEEAAAQSGDAYWRNIGYVPHLKRGFLQIYHMPPREPDFTVETMTKEELLSGSLSFDGSDMGRIKAVCAKRDVEIPDGEITDNVPSYEITGNWSTEEAMAIALDIANELADPAYKKMANTVDVTSEHRAIMDTVFNESYIHACESFAQRRQTPEARKLIFQLADRARDFNSRYSEALYGMRVNEDRFTDEDMAVLHELLVYSTIEMMRALHVSKTASHTRSVVYRGPDVSAIYLQAMSGQEFQKALSNFGAVGARNNRTYSACGLSISLGGHESQEAGTPQAAFGGFGFGEDKYGKLTFTCPRGHHNRRPPGKLLSACQHKGCKAKVTC